MKTSFNKLGLIGGIAYPILQMTAQGLIQVGGAEPAFQAPAPEIVAFFQARDTTLFEIGAYLSQLSMLAFLWFVGSLWAALRQTEDEPGTLSGIAFGAGVIGAGMLVVNNGWGLVMFRIDQGLEPQLIQTLFDQGNLNFANLWVVLGGMTLAAGLIFHGSDFFPKWLGWCSILLALGLVLARVVWTSPVAFTPYVLFWAWMIAVSLILLRRS